MVIAFYKSLLPQIVETINCLKKYGFIEHSNNKWKNGFVEVRKLGNARYTIRHDMNKNHHVTNIDDMERYCKTFLRLNGY